MVISFEALPGGVRDVRDIRADLLVLPCFSGPGGTGPLPGPVAAGVTAALGTDLTAVLAAAGFGGEIGDAFATLTLGRLGAAALLLIGLGDAAQAGPAAVRQAAMLAAPQIARSARVAVALADLGQPPAAAFAEGLLLGLHRSDGRQTEPVTPGWRRAATERVQVLTAPGTQAEAADGLRRGQLIATLTNWVRDLVNASPSEVTPDALAGQARELARAHGLACSVLRVPELRAGGFGGILGVGQGSRHEPRLVEIAYRGGDGPVIGLTGKGITFDSGGLNLKRTSEIEWMKSDMAGAATILAVLRGAAELGLPVSIDAALPFAENMPGGSAQRPGDVLTHRGGRTCEVRDTDAEGRLIVADALAYLAERAPAALVDVATLTDAAGLGESLWAVLGTDDELIGGLLAAGRDAGDPGWQLPLPAAYRRYLASGVADIRNTPADVADTTVMAATFLREFTGGLPWMHIDNGSTAYLERPGDGWPEGATGSPVRALLRWLEQSWPAWAGVRGRAPG